MMKRKSKNKNLNEKLDPNSELYQNCLFLTLINFIIYTQYNAFICIYLIL